MPACVIDKDFFHFLTQQILCMEQQVVGNLNYPEYFYVQT